MNMTELISLIVSAFCGGFTLGMAVSSHLTRHAIERMARAQRAHTPTQSDQSTQEEQQS